NRGAAAFDVEQGLGRDEAAEAGGEGGEPLRLRIANLGAEGETVEMRAHARPAVVALNSDYEPVVLNAVAGLDAAQRPANGPVCVEFHVGRGKDVEPFLVAPAVADVAAKIHAGPVPNGCRCGLVDREIRRAREGCKTKGGDGRCNAEQLFHCDILATIPISTCASHEGALHFGGTCRNNAQTLPVWTHASHGRLNLKRKTHQPRRGLCTRLAATPT